MPVERRSSTTNFIMAKILQPGLIPTNEDLVGHLYQLMDETTRPVDVNVVANKLALIVRDTWFRIGEMTPLRPFDHLRHRIASLLRDAVLFRTHTLPDKKSTRFKAKLKKVFNATMCHCSLPQLLCSNFDCDPATCDKQHFICCCRVRGNPCLPVKQSIIATFRGAVKGTIRVIELKQTSKKKPFRPYVAVVGELLTVGYRRPIKYDDCFEVVIADDKRMYSSDSEDDSEDKENVPDHQPTMIV